MRRYCFCYLPKDASAQLRQQHSPEGYPTSDFRLETLRGDLNQNNKPVPGWQRDFQKKIAEP